MNHSFDKVDFKLTQTENMGIGIYRYLGKNLTLPTEEPLFVFSGTPNEDYSFAAS
jgi:hypothetical protein